MSLLSDGRKNERYRVPPAPPVDTEISEVRGDYGMSRMQLAHTDQAQIRQVGPTVLIPLSQFCYSRQMIGKMEVRLNHASPHEIEDQRGIAKMKSRFGKYGFAGEQWLYYLLSDLNGPLMMMVISVSECNQEARVSYRFHFLEKPFRAERPGGPETLPARRRNGRCSLERAFSS